MAALKWLRPGWQSGGDDSQPAPQPDIYARMKPITSIVMMADSNGPQIGFTPLGAAGVSGGVLSYTIAANFPVGAMCEIQGAAQDVNRRGVVRSGGGSGVPSTAEIFGASYAGAVTSKDALPAAMQYALTTPNGIVGTAMARSKKYPFIKHWGARGSMSAAQILERTPLEVLPNAPSHAIFLMGTNDLNKSTDDEIVQYFKGCAKLCAAQGIQAILLAITPCAAGSVAAAAQRRIAINAAVKEWCAMQDDVFFVDVHAPIADPVTGYALPGVLSDLVHLTPYGFAKAAAPLEAIFERFAVDYLAGAVNRAVNADFSQLTAATSGFSGVMPVGRAMVKSSNATYSGTSSVADGIWTIELSGGAPGEYITLYLTGTEAAEPQTRASRQTCMIELMVDAEVRTSLIASYVLNGAVLSNANTFVDGTQQPGEWWRLAGRDIVIAEGDNFGMNRPYARVYLPDGGKITLKLRNPGVLALAG